MKRGISIFLLFLMVLFSLNFVYAQSFPSVQQNKCISITNTCPNCTYSNVSMIRYPNSNLNSTQISMTNLNGVNYLYSFCNTTILGTYITTVCSNPAGTQSCTDYSFHVTPSGTELSTGQSILYILFLIGAMLVLALVLYYAVVLPYQNTRNAEGEIVSINDLKYLKVFLMSMTYILLMSIFGFLRGITANFVPEIGVDGLFNWIYQIMLFSLWPIAVATIVFIFIMFINDKNLQKALERGVDIF